MERKAAFHLSAEVLLEHSSGITFGNECERESMQTVLLEASTSRAGINVTSPLVVSYHSVRGSVTPAEGVSSFYMTRPAQSNKNNTISFMANSKIPQYLHLNLCAILLLLSMLKALNLGPWGSSSLHVGLCCNAAFLFPVFPACCQILRTLQCTMWESIVGKEKQRLECYWINPTTSEEMRSMLSPLLHFFLMKRTALDVERSPNSSSPSSFFLPFERGPAKSYRRANNSIRKRYICQLAH